MKTGISNSSYYDENGTADYSKMHAHGYSCADYQGLTNTKDGLLFHTDDETFEKLLTAERRRANEAGIEFFQAHAPWPTDDLTAESRLKTLGYMKKALKGCALLGGQYLVVHPVMPFGWDQDDDPDFTVRCNSELFTALCAYGAELGVGVCIENMPFSAYKLSRIPALVEFIKALRLPNLFICLDTGHVHYLGDDCGEMVRLCGELLKTLHVHDNNGTRDEHRCPFDGTIDWESFRAALKEIHYDGCISLETGVKRRHPDGIHEYMQKGFALVADYLAGN